MKRNNKYKIGVAKTARRMAVGCFLLFAFAGSLMAQAPGPHVIKTGTGTNTHYLSHAGNTIGDATAFSPDCIWTSDDNFTQGGTNKNYYYFDGTNYRFLEAPVFEAGASLDLSASLPTVTDLNNPEFSYYFYRWDNGLGRGVQIYGVDGDWCDGNGHGWDGTNHECWEVYWVEYNATANTWKLSDESYNITTNGGKYYPVTVTEHPQDTTTVSGGLANLSDFQMTYGTSGSSQALNPSSNPIITLPYKYSFTPEYTTYVFDGGTHNYFNNGDQGTNVPANSGVIEANNPSYLWTIMGDAVAYLSFASGSQLLTTTEAQPTLYYRVENTTGDKTATLKLTVTYNDGSKQTRTATVTAKTSCQNPAKAADPAITDVGVTVTWYPTAESYVVYWQKSGDGDVWSSVSVGNVTSYTITGLAFGSTYTYKVSAICGGDEMPNPIPYSFTTNTEPTGMIVYGAIFGGGRMANVTGKTEVEVVNCKSINTIYGGNDIAGQVLDADGSSITLGTAATTGNISIGSVYGGGNGYYTYDGHEPGVDIGTTYHANGQFSNSVTEVGGSEVYMTSGYIPSIIKTAITVANDYIIVDSIFGGAKNAFLTASSGNGSTVTINHGIVLAVFGGNNYGGTQGAAKQHVEVTGTKIPTTLSGSIVNTSTTGYGRDYGIRYLFGGGNKVKASTTEVVITGGLCDTVFAGGNSADVATAANLQLNCAIGAGSGNTYGSIYTDAIASYSGGTITIKPDYAWDGFSGIYNVRTLFGGNNQATMNVVPNLVLTSGSVGTVYGGGNAGNMAKDQTGGAIYFNSDPELDNLTFKYSTRVTLENCPNLIADYVYGGCQMSDVLYSTWVEMKSGHVGTVYGGCNVSGDVGSTHLNSGATSPSTAYQEVLGATYVEATGGIVYKDLFAGSNGYYHCSQDGIHYTSGSFSSNNYIGLTVPTHNETHAAIRNGANIKGNVYAGGNLACVGFDDYMGTYGDRNYPELVGMASVRMDGGTVLGNVYGGGNMASIYGSNEVRVSGGTITLGLYGGNDCSGKVAEKTNRVLPDNYTVASDGVTSLTALGVKTYVGVKGNSQIGTVYGGGNGDYLPGSVQYCYDNFEPIQSFTFVDIHINGGTDGGHIRTVYGGGNGVTVRHGVTVFLNNNEPNSPYDFNNIDTIFGGNNKGNLNVTPDIYLVHGQVGTVYGGCNRGKMIGEGKDVYNYDHIGSYVRLLNQYSPNGTGSPVDVDAKVTEAVYGGCRMNGVTNNSLVLVEGGNHSAIPLFGGSDISGTVSGFSRVAVTGGTVGDVYGGGNGNYDYVSGGNVYKPNSEHTAANLVATGITAAPKCAQSGADILGGYVGTDASHQGKVFGGGWGSGTETTGNVIVNVDGTPELYGDVYGGSALGNVNTDEGETITTVNFEGGTLHGGLYGGGLGNADHAAQENKVVVTVSGGTVDNVFGCNNVNGAPQSTVAVNITGGTVNENVYGGGNLSAYTGSPVVTVSGGTVTQDVYGGGALANTGGSTVTVSDGEVVRAVYGGGLGDGGHAALVNGPVQVDISGGTVGSVFGCNNVNGTPKSTVQVNVTGGTVDNVFGGGNEAAYIPTTSNTNYPLVNISGGNVVYKVVGGGNAADIGSTTVSANPIINISGGNICTESTGVGAGVYGGCNSSGIVYGNVTVNITGSESSPTTIGTIAALEYAYDDPVHPLIPVSVHGGGYGAGTEVKGNVTVNFGEDDGTATSNCEYLKLYGDLYGGSALGTVNDGSEDQTTVNVLNGIIDGGNVFGGGLGDDTHAAKVWGVVHVNIGAPVPGSSTDFRGQASFPRRMISEVNIGGDVFGCNNKNGSPQQDVWVDVYKTAHTEKDLYTYLEIDRTYAIADVYGGGKKAVYAPDENPAKKLHTYIHNCDNTVGFVYGGCDAADAQGTEVIVDGGRFNFIFGGGNGQTGFANITGNVDLYIYGGRVGWYFVGCNLHGEIGGEGYVHLGCPPGHEPHCLDLEVENYYFGANEALTVGGLEHVIECENASDMVFKKVFAGSRLAVIYGDVKLTVRGGTIQNLFGGSEGSATVSADIKKFPDDDAGINNLPEDHRQMVREYLATHPHDYGKGGNITLILEGGTIQNIFGGNDIKGDIQGNINIIVNDRNLSCPLDIDYIYGGNNQSIYEPQNIIIGGVSQKPITPIVEVVNGTVNYDVFGGSLGGDATIVNAGKITCNPKVIIGDGTPNSTNQAHVGHIVGDVYYGEVFGGGSSGEVVGNTKVILQGKATIDNNVYGGAQRAQVTGNTNVILTPKMHQLTITQPSSGGTIAVYNSVGVQVNSGDYVPEDAYLRLVATPTAATPPTSGNASDPGTGYVFNQWSCSGAGSIIDHPSWANSTFTMGTANATLTASFTEVSARQLSMELDHAGDGSLMVDGTAYEDPVWVAENSSIRVQAIPSPTTADGGYVFNHWAIAEGTGEGASISSYRSATTDFNMGTANATLRAYFDHLLAHTLTIASSGLTGSASATFTVDGTTYSSPVYVAESTSVTVRVTPPEGYVFTGWSITGTGANIDNLTSPVTHCTMGTGDAILTATFTASSGRTNNNVNE